jgi:hypothetical protein
MSATPRQPLADEARVLRVLKKIPMFFEPPEFRRPTRKAFEPTKEDLSSNPVGVSVFDCARTTFEQAVAIRERMSGCPLIEPVRVDVDVATVRQIGERTGRRLDVIEDPIERLDLVGADGHALITGLEQAPGEPILDWKNRLAALAREAIAA